MLGHRVVVLDDLSAGDAAARNPGAELIVGSVADFDTVLAATRSADCVFHMATLPRIERLLPTPSELTMSQSPER